MGRSRKPGTGRRFNMDVMGITADKYKIYTVESECENALMYAFGKDEVALINGGGAIRIDLRDAMTLCIELPQIIKDFELYLKDCKPKATLNKLFKTKEEG